MIIIVCLHTFLTDLSMENVKRLFDIPYHQLKNYPCDDSLAARIDGKWIKHSTQDFLDNANLISRGLLKIGIEPGDKIALISNNRPEWHMLDIGILQTGAVDVPVYPTISENDYKFIFNDAAVKLCIVSSADLYAKVAAIQDEVPSLEGVYTIEQVAGAKNWQEILDAGKDGDQAAVEARKADVKAEDLATLIYTSGTTGTPKGVMISHNNIVSNCLGSWPRLPVNSDGKALSFLPICHVYERMITYLYMLTGVSIYFAESIDTIGDNLKEVKPQVFTAVPRLLEKVYDKIMAKGEELTGIKRMLFFWAVKLGHQYEVDKGGWYMFKLSIARKLIFSKWKEALGGNCLAVASGSAALQPRLARVFHAAGIPIMEGYGLTETSPVVTVNCEAGDGVRFGTVGRKLDKVDVKIAEDGEILVKGPNVMMGYYNRPDATAEAIDKDGWFHTGDIGKFIDGDFLKITDRKKEIFKTSGGKYVAPQVVENRFKESRFIEQLIVIGENEKHPAALICPDFAFLEEYCKRNKLPCGTNEEMVGQKAVIDRIMEEVNTYNKDFGNWEQVKKIGLLPNTWSVETEELTPTLKLRRKVIMAKYEAQVEKIYRG
jgi:long-chain acyl-CoA synthetase